MTTSDDISSQSRCTYFGGKKITIINAYFSYHTYHHNDQLLFQIKYHHNDQLLFQIEYHHDDQ